jgi:deoxyribonuclease-4
MLRFGTAGIPLSTPRPGTPAGIRRARELGLDCFEMAWGNGITMGEAMADRIAATARECDIELTAHAPYFINLCGARDVVARSTRRLVDSARLAHRCGARSLCFHPGFYPHTRRGAAPARVARRLGRVAARLRHEQLGVELRPELTGRASQIGTLEETLAWCGPPHGLMPCLDFSHLYARGQGTPNAYAAFGAVLEAVRARLGDAGLERVHVHISGIEFGPKGERRHRPLRESRFRYRELLRALKDCRVSGWVIAETPAMEQDALLLQRTYRRMR